MTYSIYQTYRDASNKREKILYTISNNKKKKTKDRKTGAESTSDINSNVIMIIQEPIVMRGIKLD